MIADLRKKLGARGVRALDGLTESLTAPAAGRIEQRIYGPTAPRTALHARPTRLSSPPKYASLSCDQDRDGIACARRRDR